MPPIVNIWRGDAQGVRQITHLIPGGDPEVGDKFIVTCNLKEVSYTIRATDTVDPVTGLVSAACAGLMAALEAAATLWAEFNDAAYSLGYDEDSDPNHLHATHVICTGGQDGYPFTFTCSTSNANRYRITVTTNVQGSTGVNEIQRVQLPALTSGGTFTLSFYGQVTGAIAYNASAATVQTALEGIAALVPGDVSVTGGAGTYDVEFTGAYAQLDVPMLEADGDALSGTGQPTVTITTLYDGAAGVNEKQEISLPTTVTGGTFTLTFDGQTTGAIAYNASAATVQAALEALSNLAAGEPVTTKSGAVWTVEFKLSYSGVDVPLMTGDGTSLTGGTVTVATTTGGSAGTNEIGQLNFVDRISSVNWKYRFTNPAGVTSTSASQAAADVTAVKIAAAIGGLPSVGGTANIKVTQTSLGVYSVEFRAALGNQNVGVITIVRDTSSGGSSTLPIPEYTVLTEGSATGTDEVQKVTLSSVPTGGTFTLTYSGQTTAAIAYNASAATVQTALEGLSNLAPGDVAVAGSAGGPWTVTFGGTLAATDVAEMTGSGASLTGASVYVDTTQTPVARVDEQQRILLSGPAAGGTFTLTFQGETTGTIAYDASTATVQTALEGLTTPVPGDIDVSGGPGDWIVKFQGAYAGTNVNQMTTDDSALLGGIVTVNVRQNASVTVNERQTVTVEGGATGGTFTLTLEGETTAAIAYNASAATVQTALENLTTPVPGDVTVTGAAGGPWLCSFAANFGDRDVTEMTGDGANLTGPGTQTFDPVEIQTPTGPEWFPNPDNWTAGAPADDHILVYRNTNRSCRHGLSNATITPDSVWVEASFTGDLGLPDYNENGYYEYRNKELVLGTNGDGLSAIMYVEVGKGEGAGSPLIRFNSGTKRVHMQVWRTADNFGEAIPPLLWRGTHASNAIYVYRGSIGIALTKGEVATVDVLTMGSVDDIERDAQVYVGDGVTLNTVTKEAGLAWIACAIVTSLTNLAGDVELVGVGAVAQLTARGGFVKYSTSGALGGDTVVSGPARLAFDFDGRTKTVSNPINVYGTDSSVSDPSKVVSSFVVDLYEGAQPSQIDFGLHTRLTRGTVA